ncbi:serine hydrolase domain-containing protein [Reichenbachiella versicolor]|uniref:serine hydrolase domain-containing protein n=1 Tax=Reichenbachiella versicolor TaxID=1821036 RepID=UPI000D6E4FFB|nr:serine hydrolase domain-containing protein [Reichenbachiella versicolor]
MITSKQIINNASLLFTLLPLLIGLISCSEDEDSFESSTLKSDISNQTYANILESKFNKLPNEAEVAIALVHDGITEYLGVINDNKVLKGINNENSVFEIGSITKVFASICLSEMVSSNEASMNETLQEQFDFQLKAGGNITLEQLANHTSGLPRLPSNLGEIQNFDQEDPYLSYSYDNLKSYLKNHAELNNPSGTKYEYSNLGMGVLGYCLAQKKNTTVEEMMQSIIFSPLEMTSTTTILDNVDASKLVEPRDPDGNIVSHWNFAETMSCAGSIKSSVTDMAKFILKNIEDDAVYNLPQKTTFEISKNLYMGLGWHIEENDNATIHTHSGGTGGFASTIMIDKDKKTGIIVLSNVEDYHNAIIPVCNELMAEIGK